MIRETSYPQQQRKKISTSERQLQTCHELPHRFTDLWHRHWGVYFGDEHDLTHSLYILNDTPIVGLLILNLFTYGLFRNCRIVIGARVPLLSVEERVLETLSDCCPTTCCLRTCNISLSM